MDFVQFAGRRLTPAYWRSHIRNIEDFCFDVRRHVTTGGATTLKELTVRGDSSDAHMFLPVRPANVYRAISRLPLADHGRYTFVDLGSGKGRILFIAAEYGFRRIIGVEFASELHEIATQNVSHYAFRKRKCADISCLHLNASEYDFPPDDLVVCMFNPFGPRTLRQVLRNLNSSIHLHRNHVVVVSIIPESVDVFQEFPEFTLYYRTKRFCIYQASSHSVVNAHAASNKVQRNLPGNVPSVKLTGIHESDT